MPKLIYIKNIADFFSGQNLKMILNFGFKIFVSVQLTVDVLTDLK